MPRTFLKNSLSKNFILPLKKGRRFIFTYHDISDPSTFQHSPHYSTSSERFKEQISFLSEMFTWVDLDTINSDQTFEGHVASLVFDDGFKSVQTNALPFLLEKKIPFAVFACQAAITSNRLWVSDLEFNKIQLEKDFPEFHKEIHSQNNFEQLLKNQAFQNKLSALKLSPFEKEQIYLDSKDILALHTLGVTIGNHGSAHANLHVCNEKSRDTEITENKLFLENITKSKIKHYAIAFGKKEHFTLSALDLIYGSGHSYVYSSNPASFVNAQDNKLIPRIGLTENTTKEIMFYINRQFLIKIDL